jgi:hypothetical protein
MGYRDDFYVVENFIGYSGNLDSSPTLYFVSKSEFGHITQTHRKSDNVGREKVRPRIGAGGGYFIGNVVGPKTKNELKLVEAWGGKVIHVSRGTLTLAGKTAKTPGRSLFTGASSSGVAQLGPRFHLAPDKAIGVVIIGIARFKDLKTRYSVGRPTPVGVMIQVQNNIEVAAALEPTKGTRPPPKAVAGASDLFGNAVIGADRHLDDDEMSSGAT